jgi:hypothetical protein
MSFEESFLDSTPELLDAPNICSYSTEKLFSSPMGGEAQFRIGISSGEHH